MKATTGNIGTEDSMQSSPKPTLPPTQSPAARRRSRFLVFAMALAPLAAFGAIVAFTIGIGGKLTPVRPHAEFRVAGFEGTGNLEKSEPFTVGPSWDLRWSHHGTIQQICWVDESGDDECIVAMHRKPIREEGGVNVTNGGRYHLHIQAEGPWKVEVFEFPDNRPAAVP
jgi:hypothetical protein